MTPQESVPEMDLRGLEPPEPMMRLLETLSTAATGSVVRARLERRPMFLIEELNRRSFPHECAVHPQGGWSLTVRVQTPPAAPTS